MHAYTGIAPKVTCSLTPISVNGRIHVSWSYLHTGGLNITEISVQYRQQQVNLFQFLQEELPDKNTTIATNFTAGYNYVFRVVASNEIGSDSTDCPSVLHQIGMVH